MHRTQRQTPGSLRHARLTARAQQQSNGSISEYAIVVAFLFAVNLFGAQTACGQFNVPASTVQLPTFGVAVDADGLLSATVVGDPGRRKWAERKAVAGRLLPAALRARAELRYVSLRGIADQVRTAAANNTPLPDAVRHLGGLTRVEMAFCVPADGGAPGDIILAGPSEPWAEDLTGHAIGLDTGLPILHIEDLAAALRVFPPNLGGRRPFVGCTIDPNRDSLSALQAFQKTIPRAVSQRQRGQVSAYVARGTQQALGNANIRVFGVSPRTHFAMVMVEADYCMKRIGIGLEPPPVKMPTFASSLRGAPATMFQRWWFTPKYESILIAPDRRSLVLEGQGVQLSAEDKEVTADGQLVDTGRPPSKATLQYANAFTTHYEDISRIRPVYGQLRNLVDLTVVAAVICRENWHGQSGLPLEPLLSEDLLPIETLPAPGQVACPVNVFWRGNRMLSLAGGGVQWNPDDGLGKVATSDQASARRPMQAAQQQDWQWKP